MKTCRNCRHSFKAKMQGGFTGDPMYGCAKSLGAECYPWNDGSMGRRYEDPKLWEPKPKIRCILEGVDYHEDPQDMP